jgi:hypothetical protein
MRRRLVPWLLLVGVALVYPLVVLGGNGVHFPSPMECVHPATSDSEIEAVFGRFRTQAAAGDLQQRALHSGFKGVQVEPDGCGFLKVTLHGIPSLEVGRDFVAEAEAEGFHPRLEQPAH